MMQSKTSFILLGALLLTLASSACTAGLEPTSTAALEPTVSPAAADLPQSVAVRGVSCPESFQDDQLITKRVEVAAGASITLTLGSTPSMPCGWQPPDIDDGTILRQVAHRSEWPAEDVTPQPGAPGLEIWVFEALVPGESTVLLACTCLGEEGKGQESRGTLSLTVDVR